jgi:translocation and assembly module TamA
MQAEQEHLAGVRHTVWNRSRRKRERAVVRAVLCIVVAVTVLVLPGDGYADVPRDPGPAYRVRLRGGTWGLRRRLRRVLYSLELQDHPPATPGLLRRRAEEDSERLRRALRSLGYYGGTVHLELDLNSSPARLRFTLQPGPAYLIGDVTVTAAGSAATPPSLPDPSEIGLPLGGRFEERLVDDARDRLVEWFRGAGYVSPEVRPQTVRVEHEDHSVYLAFEVAPGPVGRFGTTSVEGLDRVRETYVRKLLTWNAGDRFSSHRLHDLRQRLSASGLFSSVRLQTEESDEGPEVVNVRLGLAERPARTVRVGAGYITGPGPYLRLGWERRNLAGRGETLQLSTYVSDELYSGEAQFRKPVFLRPDQELLLSLVGTREDTDAYTSNSVRASGMVERQLSNRWTAAAGLALRRVEVEDADGKSRFALVSTPMEIVYDSSDQRLDPTRGMRLRLGADPTVDAAAPDITYLRQRVGWRVYLPLSRERRLGLATRVTVGTILGEEHDAIPADERFYAGGGGSIRGYDYKEVGPRRNGESIGGRSLAETAVELRWRLSERFGLVAFLDGGNAFLDTVPRVDRDWRWGAGGGLRYFTPIGPLRIDAAAPLNSDAESNRVRIYVSIGQSF